MVSISGKPLDVSALSYPAGSVQSLALDIMINSSFDYKYDSLEMLKFELDLRNEIVNAAKSLNKSRFAFATFHDSKSNPEYWERTNNGGFQLKKNVSAGEAIRDIYQNGHKYATECATAMLIVYYKALLELYGQERFDKTFSNIYLMDWSIRQPLLQSVGTPRKIADMLYGDRAYFINEDVDPQASWWRGENTIVLPDDLYYGHGVGILRADQIIKHLNANRIQNSTINARLMDEAARPDFAKLYEAFKKADSPARPLVWRFPAASF